jgi:hypothetical protein
MAQTPNVVGDPGGKLDAEQVLRALGRHFEAPRPETIIAAALAYDAMTPEAKAVVRAILAESSDESRGRVGRLLSSARRAVRPTRSRRSASARC